jgi:hypothetical protein
VLVTQYTERVNALTPAALKTTAPLLLARDNVARFVLLPDKP